MLLPHQARIVRDVAHDRGTDEVAGAIGTCTARDDLSVLAPVRDVPLHLLELCLVLQGSELRVGIEAVAENCGVGQLCELGAELIVDRVVRVHALGGQAHLARVQHGGHEDLRRDFLRIDVIEHDGSVVAAQLERQPLEAARDARHHLLAGGGGSGERHLRDVGMPRQRGAEIVLIGDHVDHAGGKYLRTQFPEAQRRERGGRRRLCDDGVAGEQCRRDLEHE